jgi:glycosyltransferase involved in cell wall biosynthesis
LPGKKQFVSAEIMERINLHIYPSPFTHESRILKETRSIAKAGFADRVFLVGMWKEGLPEEERVDEQRQIWRVRARIGQQESGLLIKIIRYVEWQIRIFFHFLSQPVHLVNVHSLPVLPLGVLFKFFKRVTLVYDTHELETEGAGSVGIKRVLYKLVERSLIPFVDAVIAVNQSIADWYEKEYHLQEVASVRNIPYQVNGAEFGKENILKERFRIPEDHVLYIFQGTFGPGRGIELMLKVFARVNPNNHVVFMGFGEWEPTIKEYEKKHENIHYHQAVSPKDVGRYTRGADVGLCLQENIGLNYYLSLPNKLFEYIMSGVPPIVSDFPEMARVVDQGQCGWDVEVKEEALYSLISEITRKEINEKRENTLRYRKTLGWHKEEAALIDFYQKLLGDNLNQQQRN